jgi:hypothetical protein
MSDNLNLGILVLLVIITISMIYQTYIMERSFKPAVLGIEKDLTWGFQPKTHK